MSFRLKSSHIAVFCMLLLQSEFVGAMQTQDNPIVESEATLNETIVEENEITRRYESGEELIITLELEKYLLGEIFTVVTDTDIAFDFESLMSLVEFPIVRNNSARKYNGWYISPANRISINLSNIQQIVVTKAAGETQFSSDDLFYIDDILYISRQAMIQIFDIDFDIRAKSLTAKVLSKETLPVLQRVSRQNRSISNSNRSLPQYTELRRGYGLLSPQILDVQGSLTYRSTNSELLNGYSLIGARDILGVGTNFFVSGSDADSLSNARLTVNRESIKADMLGFLGASRVEVGDVKAVRQTISGGDALGVRIQNGKLDGEFDLDSTNIVGPVQIGWDVELYRNGVLIEQLFAVDSGQYEFLDVPLNFGENDFEIILYSPQGEIVIDTKSILIDKNVFESQDLLYDVSLVDNNRTVFNGQNNNSNQDINLGYGLSGSFRKSFGGNGFLQAGISTDFGGDFELSTVNLTYSTLILDNTFLSLSYARNTLGSSVYSLGTRAKIFGQPIGISASFAETTFAGTNFTAKTKALALSHSGSIPIVKGFAISSDTRLRYSTSSGLNDIDLENSLTSNTAIGAFSLINNFERSDVFNRDLGRVLVEDSHTGSLSYNKGFGPVFFRLGSSYGKETEDFEFTNVFSSVNWNVSRNHRLSFDYTQNLLDDFTRYSIQYGLRTSIVDVYTNASVNHDGEWELGASFRFGLSGQESRYNSNYLDNNLLTSAGNITVRVFEDANLNAVYDEGEFVLEGVEVQALQHFAKGVTNDEGIAFLSRIPNQKHTDITINQDTLPDFYLTPLINGVSIRFRQGYTDHLDFPVALTKEVEGTIFIASNSVDTLDDNAVRSVPIIVKDKQGKVVKKATSEYDGFYLISGLFDGEYTIEIAPSFVEQKRWIPQDPINFIVDVKDDEYVVVEFIFEEYPQAIVYFSKLGEFSSLQMASLYANLLKNKNGFSYPVYLNTDDDGYMITSDIFLSEQEAAQYCEYSKGYVNSCDVLSKSIIVN